jgi:flagellar motor switch protein FliM
MTESTHATLLRRKIRSPDQVAAENPLTSSRAVRLALTKAANDAVGLVLTVSSVADDVITLDALLDGLPAGLMLVGLHRQDRLVGLIALDMQLRAAVLEMETMGAVSPHPAEDRAPTRTDKMLCDPLMAGFIGAFPQAVRGTALDGWGDHVTHEDRIADARTAGLILDDCTYRMVQMNVQLGPADRQGVLLMALPMIDEPETVAEPTPLVADWNISFPKAVQDAPAAITALLHRFSVPLAMARALQIGTILPLPGCSVSSVRLLAPDGKEVAQAKLGQSGGMRAVRLQAAPLPDLHDILVHKGANPASISVESKQDLPVGRKVTPSPDAMLATENEVVSPV